MQNYDYQILDLINMSRRQYEARALVLGGIASSSGGSGGPPGGFVGWLPQRRVAYDTAELATLYTPPSGESLYDNLNHIRYRIQILESGGGGHSIYTVSSGYPQRSKLRFLGSVVVTDNPGNNSTDVTISGGGGSIPDQADSTLTGRAVGAGTGTPGELSALQGIKVLATEFGSYDETLKTLSLYKPFSETIWSNGKTSLNIFGESPSYPYYNSFGFGASPGVAGYYANGTFASRSNVSNYNTLLGIETLGWADGDWQWGPAIYFNADDDWTSSNQTSKIVFYTVLGTTGTDAFTIRNTSVNIPAGSTYNIDGVPHTHGPSADISPAIARSWFL
jgi:hypothetical protein